MQSRSNLEYSCRVFRCFIIYNCNSSSVIVSIKRKCGALLQNTLPRVKDYVKQNILDSQRNQIFLSGGDRCEWHGILDEKANCYFLMMTFPSSSQATVRSSLLEMQQITLGLLNYSKYSDADFPVQKRNELIAKIDDLELKYVNEHGQEGQPDQNEINDFDPSQVKAGSEQFLQSRPQIQQKPSTIKSKINEQYRKFSVYRCFYVYNVQENKNLFLIKRGSARSFDDSKGNLLAQLKKSINETTKLEVYMQGNQRSEWHGILDDSKFCYFLMMTFPSTQQKIVKESLQELKKTFLALPNYDKMSQHDLEKKLMPEITKAIDNLEVKYFNLNGNEGIPSDAESDLKKQSDIRRDFVESKPLEVPGQKIFASFNKSDNLMPPEIGDSGQKLIESAEMNVQQELKNLKIFKPNLQDAQYYIYSGIGMTVFLFAVLIFILV